jgi:hypothetical protein
LLTYIYTAVSYLLCIFNKSGYIRETFLQICASLSTLPWSILVIGSSL